VTHLKCTKCHHVKLLECFGLDKHKASGRVSACKECKAAGDKARYQRNADVLREQARERANRAYATDPAYASRVKAASLARTRANAEENRQRARDWRKANPEAHRANASAWQRNNPAAAAAIGARKRAAKGRALPPWANRDAIRKVYAEAAALRAQGHDVEVDHIIPLQGKNVSGLHVENNLRVIPALDNARKGNRL